MGMPVDAFRISGTIQPLPFFFNSSAFGGFSSLKYTPQGLCLSSLSASVKAFEISVVVIGLSYLSIFLMTETDFRVLRFLNQLCKLIQIYTKDTIIQVNCFIASSDIVTKPNKDSIAIIQSDI
jgi:hypothetical protein